MRSIFSYTFTAMLASVTIVVVVLSGIFVFGLERSIAGWNVHRDQQVQNRMLPVLSRLYYRSGRLSGRAVSAALAPYLAQNLYVYVTSMHDRPIYLFMHGKRIRARDKQAVRSARSRLKDRLAAPAPITDNGRVVGYLDAGTFGFRHSLVNKIFVRNIFTTVASGFTASLLFALAVAFIFSRFVSRQAASLSQAIGEVASGRRDVSFRDEGASELRSIAASARDLQQRLFQVERQKRYSTQDIAHDLKTPVTALKAQFEAMIDGVVSPTHERLQALFDEVEQIEYLSNGLHELIRIESSGMTLKSNSVSVEELLHELTSHFELRAQELGIELRLNCETTTIRADANLLRRALSNVVDNALRYSPPGDSVRIEARHEQHRHAIRISNSGYIAPIDRELVFERFYRGNDASRRHGSGLGLSIARTIIRLHSGTIAVLQEGGRVVVAIRLPDRPLEI